MSTITWAARVRCDYPQCQSIADVTLREDGARELPAGWVDLAAALVILRDGYGIEYRELCSLHADTPVSGLARTLSPAEVSDGDRG